MLKNVLITGITGQDGSLLADYLLKNTGDNIIVYGAGRKKSIYNNQNIKHIINNKAFKNKFKLVNFDLNDQNSIINIIKKIKPHYIFNFASQSFVSDSWNCPTETFTVNTLSIIYFLEAIREYIPECRFFSAGSSYEFGNVIYSPQDINHPNNPNELYGVSKCAAKQIINIYRKTYNIYAVHAILYNHESSRRGIDFVTKKISYNMSRIKRDMEKNIYPTPFKLGNINIKRDWSDAEDFVEAIWKMMNLPDSRNYMLSSNTSHSIKEFVDKVYQYLDLDCKWVIDNKDPTKTYLLLNNSIKIIEISREYYRPNEIESFMGDASETMKLLNWSPKISFEKMIQKMVDYDLKNL